MNVWRWLSTPDPSPGYPPRKLARIAARFLLFLLFVTLVQSLIGATPLRPYAATWWGSALVVFLLYLPFGRFLSLDTPGAARRGFGRPAAPQVSVSAQRRKERNRYAGVRKGPPGGRGGRR